MKTVFLASFLVLAGSLFLSGQPMRVSWPTPHRGFINKEDWSTYIQPTASGNPESGLFGCVRNSGTRFHEGIDILPIGRDRSGEATDSIFAVMEGRVVHISSKPGNSSYGRYVVIEHDHLDPAPISLYAHLRSIEGGLEVGDRVKIGEVIGVMGRSAGGYSIPKQRAHLHFELGLLYTKNFQQWYDKQRFGSKNLHGKYNGMNIVSVDPLDFYTRYQNGTATDFYNYLQNTPTAFVLRVALRNTPTFVRNYPALVSGPIPPGQIMGWDIEFTGYGLPKRWTPLADSSDPLLKDRGNVSLIYHNSDFTDPYACRDMIDISGGKSRIGDGAKRIIQLLFDL